MRGLLELNRVRGFDVGVNGTLTGDPVTES